MSNIDKTKFMGSKEAVKILGIHPNTLYNWEKKGIIEVIRSTSTGKRFYNVDKYLKNQGLVCTSVEKEIKCSTIEELEKKKRIKICYARVSSINQKNDLERQKEELKSKYPEHELIEDIGSGINLTKKGIQKIIELGIEGKIEELVVAHKDRLARFGYELIEHIIKKYSNGKIIIMNEKKDIEPEEEMVKDVLQIMNVFVAKMNGRRKYGNKKEKKKVLLKIVKK
jgi:predicted site-specific integrase-resolvase